MDDLIEEVPLESLAKSADLTLRLWSFCLWGHDEISLDGFAVVEERSRYRDRACKGTVVEAKR